MIRILKNIYHLLRAYGANLLFGFPGRKLKIIGVTGTDGKTTTTHLIYHILLTAGKRVSMISTIYAKVGSREYDTGFHVTTPDAFMIPRFLRRAVAEGDEYFVLETTSHRLDQNQVAGIRFHAGVVTNITHEHLDYHHTYENYVQSKMRLLSATDRKIVNRDDGSYPYVQKFMPQGTRFITYGLKNKSDYHTDFRKTLKDLADFNAYNYLAAFAVCDQLGISEDTIIKAFRTFKLPPGRIDIVYDRSYKAIVDFAHTPNAIRRILETVRKTYLKKGRIIHVFGSAGLRDATKRFSMGQESAKGADLSIVTEEDHRTEDPRKICGEIAKGLETGGFSHADVLSATDRRKYQITVDRAQAIRHAISIARAGDIVLITGKGHEKSLCRGKTEYPWDDRKAVLESIPT